MTRLAILLFAANALIWAQHPDKGVVKPLSDVKFEQDEDVKCLQSATEAGDPLKGPSTFMLKAPPNCLVPWHYHTAAEQLVVVSGTVLTEMENMSPGALGPGGFAMMPGKAKHQFSCRSKSPCVLLVSFDRIYDIFWVKDARKPAR